MIELALRNIFRNTRRTVITLFLVISGTFLVTLMRFVAYGFQQDVIAHVVRINTGFLVAAAYGWQERPTLSRALEVTPDFLETLEQETGKAISPRVQSGALLNVGDKTRFITVLAADPEREKEITTLHNLLLEGTLPVDRGEIRGAIVGHLLARSLHLKPGDTFYLITSQMDGSLGAIKVRLTGIFQSNQSHLDSSWVQITDQAGEELFGNRSKKGTRFYTSVAMNVENYKEAERLQSHLQSLFPPPVDESGLRPGESDIYDPVFLGWKELNPATKEMMTIAQQKMDIFLVFFVLSIAFGVLNTVQMSIQERIREFGVLMAIGTRQRDLIRMLLWEITFLLIPGVLLGVALAAGLATYFHSHPIELSGALAEVYRSMGALPRYRPIVEMDQLLLTASSLIVPSFLLTLISLRRIMRLDPVRVIKLI